MERFFTLKHLSRERLHDLYHEAVKVGTLLVEYDKPGEEGHYDVSLPEEDILANIRPGEHNYVAVHEKMEDLDDATVVTFPLVGHPHMTAYIDIDNSHIEGLAERYGLTEWWQMEAGERRYYPFSEFRTAPSAGDILIRIDPDTEAS